jgi:hypothetical protein
MGSTSLGFLRSSEEMRSGIYIPKYYDPSIEETIRRLEGSHRLLRLGDLVDAGQLTVHYGHDIGKHHYGLGNIPYVRTSDLATWEIVSAPKQTVSRNTFDSYASRQDVRAGDVFFIRDGLYLIGRVALVTENDLPLIHQSHLLRFRPSPGSTVDGAMLLGLLSTPIVVRQVRSKQFTAGIIDKIEDRYRELLLPLPADEVEVRKISKEIAVLVHRRVELRELLKKLPLLAQGAIPDLDSEPSRGTLKDGRERLGHVLSSDSIRSTIMIPKYYDPLIASELRSMRDSFEIRRIGDLVDEGVLSATTGIEVGKLAYGGADVPFIRTSDLADWELAGQPKQRVTRELYETLCNRVDVCADDILLVRDGTYLVGTSAILTSADAEALYAGGLYKLRVMQPEFIDPYLLLVLLNMPIVKAQMRAKQFTRDIIDTLGRRLFEILLPIPKALSTRRLIGQVAREVVNERTLLRDRAKSIVLGIEGAVTEEQSEEREVAGTLAL